MATPSRARSARLRARLSGHSEVAVALVLLAVFGFFRLRIDAFVPRGRGRTFLDPDAWPGAILSFMVVLCAAYLVKAVRQARGAKALLPDHSLLGAAAEGEAEAAAGGTGARSPATVWRLAAGFTLLFGYIYLMRTLGFVPSTALFCVAFLIMVGERRWWMVAAIPVAVSALVLAIFTRLLVVPLPRGRGVFLELSTYLY